MFYEPILMFYGTVFVFYEDERRWGMRVVIYESYSSMAELEEALERVRCIEKEYSEDCTLYLTRSVSQDF